MRVLAIDPGASTGWAIFHSLCGADWELFQCGVADIDEHVMPGGRPEKLPASLRGAPALVQPEPSFLVIEIPQITKYTPNPASIITLALNAGRWIERSKCHPDNITKVFPTTWKGQVKKEIHHPRILAALTEGERNLIPKLRSQKAQGDMMDAVGLGLWHVGRMLR